MESDLTGLRASAQRSRLDRDLESAVYRLVQEGLTNVVKHARAGSVKVSVRESDEEVLVEIQDDGVGFDLVLRAPGSGSRACGSGCCSPAARSISPPAREGTLLTATLPADGRLQGPSQAGGEPGQTSSAA